MTDPITPQFKCEDCERTFAHKAALISHQRTHARVVVPEMPQVAPEPSPGQAAQDRGRSDYAHLLGPELAPHPTPEPPPQVLPGAGWVMMNQPGAENGGNFVIHPNVAGAAGAAPFPNFNVVQGRVGCLPYDVTVKVKKLPHYGALPDLLRATLGSAAVDLYAAITDRHTIRISNWALIPTGIAIELPPGWVAKVVPRSGLAAKSGITVLNTPGIIDSDYRGEIKINLINNTTSNFHVLPGMRIAQMLIERVPVVNFEYVDELSETARGTGGFGSTGV